MIPSPKKFVTAFNPYRLTQRISLQSGVFMCPGNVNEPFEKNLENLGNGKKGKNIYRFILKLSGDDIKKFIDNLYELKITHASLFPGLDGFSESLKLFPPKKTLW